MTDKIPESVMQEARAAAMRALMVPEHEMVDSVARALMARDQRAAEIARKHRPSWLSPNTAHLQQQADSIASTILSYDEAQQ